MGQDTFNKLCTELENYIVKQDACFWKAGPLQQRLAVTLEIGYQCRVQNTCSVNGNWPFYSLSKTRIPCKILRQGCWPVSGKFFLCLRQTARLP